MVTMARCSITPASGMQAKCPSLVGSCKLQRAASTRPCLSKSAGGEKLCLATPSRKQQVWRCSADGFQKTQHVLQARSMEEVYNMLAERFFTAVEATRPGRKYLVGLAGPPGAGKSTVATEVVNRVNAAWRRKALPSHDAVEDIAIALPMDGFHLYRRQLDAMEDPVEAHARRGAPWTFDPASLHKCLLNLRIQGSASFPSFDHGVGDPIEEDIIVTQRHIGVLVEGNYLLLADGPWEKLASLFDETWFIQVDIDEAMQRVTRRHISTGNIPEHASWRVLYNDKPNAELIAKSAHRAHLLIPSISYMTS